MDNAEPQDVFQEAPPSGVLTIRSPASGQVLGTVPARTRAEIDRALDAAREAQRQWRTVPAAQRAAILRNWAHLIRDHRSTLQDFLVGEIAKNPKDAGDEVDRSVDYVLYTAEEGLRVHGEAMFADTFPGQLRDKLSVSQRVPLGLVLAIAPFNYPLNLAVTKLAPALMAGNAVIFKPPTQGAVTGLKLVELAHAAGVPEPVLYGATGRGADIGEYLIAHPAIHMIAFTGSTATGLQIAERAKMVPLSLELGGKDAALVLEDADLDLAAREIVSGAFSYSGQRCTAVKRVLVVDGVADALTEKVVARAETLTVGMPESGSVVTPLISQEAADAVWILIETAVENGARALTPMRREANLIWPVVLADVTEAMPIAWVEPFGPVLPIIRVPNVEAAIHLANQSEYGLQAAVFTRDVRSAIRLSERLEVGSVHINGRTSRGPDHFPFLGTKASGMGAQGIRYALESMSRLQSTVLHL